MTRRQLLADLSLLLVVFVWGATFVMVQDAVRVWPVFAFLSLRFGIAALAFLPLLWWKRRGHAASPGDPGDRPRFRPSRRIVLAGVVIGLVLAAGYAFQTFGLRYTTPAKAGFITGTSVVMVPIGAAFFLRQPVEAPAILGVILATVGLALLSLNQDLSVGFGDLLVLFCAVSFAVHILLVGRYAPRVSATWLAALQVTTVAVATFGLALLTELPQGIPPLTGSVLFAAAFTGLLATTMAFTFQASAQRFTSATHTALIFSLEPVFAALASYVLIGEQLTGRVLWGCALILAGMLSAEFGSVLLAVWRRRRLRDNLRRAT